MGLKMLTSEPSRTGAPYSAREVSTSVQINPDGTKGPVSGPTRYIDQETVTYRDSLGRVRNERPGIAAMQLPFFKIITIEDPVAGYLYFLDTTNHVAHRMALPADRPAPVAAADEIPMAPAHNTTETVGPGITRTVEALGPAELFGVATIGRRTTTTYGPDSQTGKDHPVTTTMEIWRAPALGIIVSTRNINPASVESTTTTTELKTTEPDPALLQPPPGYKIEDESSPFTIQIPR